MHRQSLVDYGKPLEATEAPTPAPKGSEVLLKVTHCGVCHSDIHLRLPREPSGAPPRGGA